MTLNERIQQIIAEECFLKPGAITPTAMFADLGVDSLAQIQIWMRIGQEFEIEIPAPDNPFWADHPVQNLTDILSVVNAVKELPAGSTLAIQSASARN
jgi:acyl carrier protein